MESIDWNKVDKKIKRFSLENEIKTAKCVDVYDGDTIQLVFPLQNQLYRWTCRLTGIDTPELRTRNKTEKKFGYIVRNTLREKILNKMVVVECGEFDKYGRLLGKIFLKTDYDEKQIGGNGGASTNIENLLSINQWLIDNKYAFSYDGGKKNNWEEYLTNNDVIKND